MGMNSIYDFMPLFLSVLADQTELYDVKNGIPERQYVAKMPIFYEEVFENLLAEKQISKKPVFQVLRGQFYPYPLQIRMLQNALKSTEQWLFQIRNVRFHYNVETEDIEIPVPISFIQNMEQRYPESVADMTELVSQFQAISAYLTYEKQRLKLEQKMKIITK